MTGKNTVDRCLISETLVQIHDRDDEGLISDLSPVNSIIIIYGDFHRD
jgi:hypothetical protein